MAMLMSCMTTLFVEMGEFLRVAVVFIQAVSMFELKFTRFLLWLAFPKAYIVAPNPVPDKASLQCTYMYSM